MPDARVVVVAVGPRESPLVEVPSGATRTLTPLYHVPRRGNLATPYYCGHQRYYTHSTTAAIHLVNTKRTGNVLGRDALDRRSSYSRSCGTYSSKYRVAGVKTANEVIRQNEPKSKTSLGTYGVVAVCEGIDIALLWRALSNGDIELNDNRQARRGCVNAWALDFWRPAASWPSRTTFELKTCADRSVETVNGVSFCLRKTVFKKTYRSEKSGKRNVSLKDSEQHSVLKR